MRKFLLLIFLSSGFSAMAQESDSLFIRKLADDILANGKAYENLRVLCKTVGARLAGSPGMLKAEAWGVKTLREMGADKVWLQDVQVPHWVRGGKDEASITYTDRKGKKVSYKLDILALGNSLGSGPKGVSGPVMLVHDFDELERRKDEVTGKIVVYDNAFDPRYVATGEAYIESGVYRRSGPSRAAKYGAIGVMIRSLSQSVDNNPHTGSTAYDSTQPKIPCAAMGLKDSDLITRLFKEGIKITGYLKTSGFYLPDATGHNVIGELTGSEFPDQYITVGGHLDSWDVNEGANDDGTGCVQAIEVLKAMKAIGYKPKRTIRVVLFANEENGLRGGRKYAEEGKAKNEKHVFGLESDNGGFTPRGFEFVMAADKVQKLRASWLPLLKPYGVYEFLEGAAGADVMPLNRLMQTPVSELRPDSQRYFDLHHARNDVFENVHKRELELGAVNMAALIYLVDKYGL